uniref:Uncharacterized protein n=1 Tax=Cajanus cajan TaxID=3821 RepID=A0A151QS67_CAJCA|nr:hypothetical protein KK1_046071 [Cajanus cajan]
MSDSRRARWCQRSTPLLSESWRLYTSVAATVPRNFVTEGGGDVVYMAFPGVEMVAASTESNWRKLVALDSIGDMEVFSARRNKEGHEPVMVHAGMLNLFSTVFDPIQN